MYVVFIFNAEFFKRIPKTFNQLLKNKIDTVYCQTEILNINISIKRIPSEFYQTFYLIRLQQIAALTSKNKDYLGNSARSGGS